jgi:uncharacterized membrane protein YhdT
MNDNKQYVAPDGYKAKHAQMNREAAATFICAAVVMVFWWFAGFGLADSDITILYMPLWFVAGSFGSWFLSIALVVVLVRRVFKNFDLEDDDGAADDAKGAAL